MRWIPEISSQSLLFLAIIATGLARDSIMGDPYVKLINKEGTQSAT
jgi:hypothetical protein